MFSTAGIRRAGGSVEPHALRGPSSSCDAGTNERLCDRCDARRDGAQGAFTLLELLVALAVLGILTAIAAPSFADAVAESRLKGIERTLAATLRGARSEADVRRSRVVVCARATDATCGDDWTEGWLVFADGRGGGALDLGPDETVLHVQPPLVGGQVTLALTHRAPWSSGPSAANAMRMVPGGRVGTSFFLLCDRRGTERARALLVSSSGAVRAYPVRQGGGAGPDPWNATIECPS